MKLSVIKFVLSQKAVIFPSAFLVLTAIPAKSYLEASFIKGLISPLMYYPELAGGTMTLLTLMPEDGGTHKVPAALRSLSSL